MNKQEDKKIITVQLPNELYEQLLHEAADNMLSLSAYIRLLILRRNEQTKK